MVELVAFYETTWCSRCKRLKKFLEDLGITVNWIDIDKDKEASRIVIELNNGKRKIPTLVFSDDTFLVNPDNNQILNKLGLSMYDM
ncbi:MAG: NrdH-redoxin [Candidatus Heimdallarchaeota archaeon]|nr:NrdH-redoxin [Candidatus Heimdallarchaeota archaeon]